ncbi:MAG: carbon-nitrogen hydrolase family protein [Deltaproteobacteria bacterium]|nr:carbon-nitrogen hydrolase family protein [Deltaproteobacteria bacterium]MBW1962077.1 carbon-nitrogen hydrolase family protein [Deltaproteobacteria bacterium]MBW1993785.1 carbon-nitrogen hydrolase family protein [Deltaproteobacteria bacterium]MBW2151563.1 carbon-nitrogen hydrolase family protein [Deltaproteobacteria bacterium]
MNDHFQRIKVAVIQAASVLFDREATVEKACSLAKKAASEGARLLLFPEAFIPAYPRGLSFGAVVGSRSAAGRRIFKRYWANSVDIPGPETKKIGNIAKATSTYIVIGLIERDSQYSRGTLYCTLAYFGPDGRLLGKHRKLVPTGSERLIWGAGDGSTLPIIEADFGKIGGLICWENYMPLARTAMYAKGVEIYLAPTADARDTWQATLTHIACEGRCFVLGCNQFVTKDMYPKDLETLDELNHFPDIICRGGSAIISPLGKVLAGPLYDREGMLFAELDMGEIAQGKYDFDPVGHYARPDVFQLIVNEQPALSVSTKTPQGT